MALFSRSLLPDDQRRTLRQQLPDAGKVLAVGHGDALTVAACVDCLAVKRDASDWEQVGWHLIATGSWADPVLRWTLVDGAEASLTLTDSGDVPGVFKQRVRSSIVVEQSFEAPGGGHIVVAGRRRLGVDAPVVWQVTTLGRANLTDPVVADFAVRKTADLRAEFDLC